MEETPPLPTKGILASIVAGFFVLSLIVYGSSLGNNFVSWDDKDLIYNNHITKGMSRANIKDAFTSYDPELYIPLTFLSYQIDYAIGGLKPAVYHTHNLILHTLNALLVAWLLYLLVQNGWIALLAGAVFLVHPLNTEAIAWASARKDVLSTFSALLGIVSYLYWRQRKEREEHSSSFLYSFSILFFLLGLLAKVSIIALPLLLLLIDYFRSRKWSWTLLVEKIPYFLLSIAFGVIAMFGKREQLESTTILQKMLMAAKSTAFYLQKIFLPTKLSPVYPYNHPISLSSGDFLIPVMVIAVLIAVAWHWRKWKTLHVGLLFFLLALIPSFINFAKGGDFYFASDRYAYIPMIGILLILTMLVRERLSRRDQMGKMLAGSALLLAFLGYLSQAQAKIWQDSEVLLTYINEHYPDSVAAHVNLSILYRETGRLEQAMQELRKAEQIRDRVEIHTNIAAIYKRQGRSDLAVAEYLRSIEKFPAQSYESHFGIGIIYAEQGRLAEAVREYEVALKLEPTFVAAYNNLAGIYEQQGKMAASRRDVQEKPHDQSALRRRPLQSGHHL